MKYWIYDISKTAQKIKYLGDESCQGRWKSHLRRWSVYSAAALLSPTDDIQSAEWWPSPSTINHIFKINDKHGILFCHISMIRLITARSNDPYHGLIKSFPFQNQVITGNQMDGLFW